MKAFCYSTIYLTVVAKLFVWFQLKFCDGFDR